MALDLESNQFQHPFEKRLHKNLQARKRVIFNPQMYDNPLKGVSETTERHRAEVFLSRFRTITRPDSFQVVERDDCGVPMMSKEDRSKSCENGFGYFAEALVECALEEILQGTQFEPALAPAILETGDSVPLPNDERLVKEEGIDLIIGIQNNTILVPFLGINVKLAVSYGCPDGPHRGYQRRLNSPSVNLKLGNWLIRTREHDAVYVRTWMLNYALPAIIDQTKIPHFNHFKRFIVASIYRKIYFYKKELIKGLDSYNSRNDQNFIFGPYSDHELLALVSKIDTMLTLFGQLSKSNPYDYKPIFRE